MGKPLSGDQDLSKAYQNGRCRDCNASIQPLGPSSRCEPCDEKRQQYEDSDWGLEDLVRRKITDRDILGLCFICGDSLTQEEDQLVCPNCRWSKSQNRSGYKLALYGDSNPYKTIWDAPEDNSVCLTPSYGIMSDRILAKARNLKWMAERGGPRGREYLEDANIYFKIAEGLKAKETELRRMR